VTNAFVAIDGVDRDVVQAARGVGMGPLQMLLRVELPLAVPLLFAGIRTAALYVMATTPLASTTGGTGLGDVIVNKASYGTAGLIAAMLCVTALAFIAEGLLALLQRALTPPPLRGRGEAFAVGNV
jgi:osmoprotectant transport system permease protein